MEEIKFYGFSRIDASAAKPATQVKLRSLCPIKVPFAYIFTRQTLADLKPGSFSWPVRVRLVIPDTVYTPWELVKGFDDLAPYQAKLNENEGWHLLISRPPVVDPEYRNLFFYLGTYYLLAFDAKTQEYLVLNTNLEALITNEGLNREHVYRLMHGSPSWYLENVIPEGHEDFKVLKNHRINILLEAANCEEFKSGFRHGFNSPHNLDLRSYLFSFQLLGCMIGKPFNYGFMVGAHLQTQIQNIFQNANLSIQGNIPTKNETMALKIVGGEPAVQSYNKIREIHNLIQAADPTTVMKAISAYYGGFDLPTPNMQKVLENFEFLAICLRDLQAPRNPAYDLCQSEIPEVDDTYKISSETSVEAGQFRITYNDGASVKLRFQGKKMKVKQFATFKDGSSIEIGAFSQNQSEIDLVITKTNMPEGYADFDDFRNKISGVHFAQQSQAGTQQVYAPLNIVDSHFCCGDIRVFHEDVMYEYLKTHCGMTIDISKLGVKNEQ